MAKARRSFWGRVVDVFRRAARGRPSLGIEAADPPERPIGESGLLNRTWFSRVNPDNEELNTDFADMSAWVRTALSMLRTDPVLRGAWEYVCQRQMGALDAAYWAPSEDTEAGRRNAAFLNEAFGLAGFRGRGRMWKGLRAQWRQILMWQPVGAVLMEEVDFKAKDAGGVERIWLRAFEPRSLRQVVSWIPSEDGTYMVAAIMRRADGSEYRLPICNDPENPGRGSLLISNDIEGGDPEGRLGALLRSAYGYWLLKRLALDQLGVGLERWGSEMPVGTINYEALVKALGQGTHDNKVREMKAALAVALRDMKAREEAYAIDSDIASIKPFGARFEPDPLGGLVETLDRQMLTSFFMQGITLGVQSGGTGSFNAATVHQDGALQIMANYGELTAEAVTEQTGRRLIHLNYGEGSPVPRLVLPGISRDPLPEMAAHIAQAVQNGCVTPTDDVEAAYRRAAGLPLTFPSRTPEERRGQAPGAAPGSPGPGRPVGPVAPAATLRARGRRRVTLASRKAAA